MIPRSLLSGVSSQSLHWEGQTSYTLDTEIINKPSTINGYTPKNNKLFTYPYNFMIMANNNGTSNVLKYEKFNHSSCYFSIVGVPVVGGSVKCVPTDYEFSGLNEENSIPAGRFPTLNWTKNNYAEWLRLNALNMNVGIGLGLAQIGTGIVSNLAGAGSFSQKIGEQRLKGNVEAWNKSTLDYSGSLGGILGGIEKIGGIMLENYQHELIANSSVGNVNNGDINVSHHKMGFFFYHKSIKREFAKIIDEFFSMFGYKVNEVKLPNITGRLNWNYVKLLNPNIEGTEIPESELNEYKSQLENGITFWHNPQTFRDYSQSNNIV